MDELDKFKEFVNFCKDNKVLNAKNGDMEVSLMYEPKMIDFGDVRQMRTPDLVILLLFNCPRFASFFGLIRIALKQQRDNFP